MIMNPKVYFDEAGNTGSNITNQQQPYFVLSSVSYTDEELSQIQQDVDFKDEMHFTDIKGRKNGRIAIRKLLNHPLFNQDHVTYQIVDKKFALYAYMVDMLIEPFMHYRLNEDLYKNRGNIIIANCFYSLAENEIKKNGITGDYLCDLKECFEKMMRVQTKDSIADFYETLNILVSVTNGGLRDVLMTMQPSEDMLDLILTEDKKYCLDFTLSSFLVLIDHWHRKFETKIDAVPDNSKVLFAKREVIKQLMNIDGYQSVGYDTRKMTYPPQINSLNFVDSKKSYGAQIADVVASAVAFSLTGTKGLEEFQNEIKESALSEFLCYQVTPTSAEFLSEEVDSSNDSNPLDFILEKFVERGNVGD